MDFAVPEKCLSSLYSTYLFKNKSYTLQIQDPDWDVSQKLSKILNKIVYFKMLYFDIQQSKGVLVAQTSI